jgi:hypothetical protein
MYEFKVSDLQISSTVYSVSRNDFLDSLILDVNNEKHEQDQEENEVQEALGKAKHLKLEKLTKPSCINLLNNTYQCYASQYLLE